MFLACSKWEDYVSNVCSANCPGAAWDANLQTPYNTCIDREPMLAERANTVLATVDMRDRGNGLCRERSAAIALSGHTSNLTG